MKLVQMSISDIRHVWITLPVPVCVYARTKINITDEKYLDLHKLRSVDERLELPTLSFTLAPRHTLGTPHDATGQ